MRMTVTERARAAQLARTFRERRQRLGVTQATVASMAGCSTRTVRAIEAGPPHLDLASRLDAALRRLESEAAEAESMTAGQPA